MIRNAPYGAFFIAEVGILCWIGAYQQYQLYCVYPCSSLWAEIIHVQGGRV